MRLAYVHLPRFPVQRRVRDVPALARKPVVLVEVQQGHKRVVFASTAALGAGVRAGMTQTAACALVPGLTCLPYSPQEELGALASLGEALLQVGPQFQLHPPEGLYLDAAAAPLCGGEEGLGRRVLELCRDHGYRAKVAVAKDPFTARALARHGAKRVLCVSAHDAAAHLCPLPLAALDGRAQGLVPQLAALGLKTLGEVAQLPPGAVVARLGGDGLRAQRLCRGEDDTLFVSHPLAETLEEQVDLGFPAHTLEPVLFALKTALDRLCARLSGRGRAAVRLDLTFKLDPGGEARIPLRLARPGAEPKLLLDLARHRLSELSLPNPVAQVAVQVAESCEDRGQQLPLGGGRGKDAALEVVLSRLTTTLGEEALFSAAIRETHRPEAGYAPASFAPKTRPAGLLAEAAGDDGSASAPAGPRAPKRAPTPPPPPEAGITPDNAWLFEPDAQAPGPEPASPAPFAQRPSRMFGRPASLEAEVGEGGALRSARVLGRRRRVEAVAGPERLCGDWWEQAAFARDYYRVHFEGMGPVWIYRDERDGRFYLHGMFD